MNDPFSDEPKGPPLEVEPQGRDVLVNVGCEQSVHVCKLYGPLIFADIRVRAEHKTCEWVIERHTEKIEGERLLDIWTEVARIPGQKEGDFTNE